MKFILALSTLALISFSNTPSSLALNQTITHPNNKSLQNQFLLNTAKIMQVNAYKEKFYRTAQIVSQRESDYQNFWSSIKQLVPRAGNKKSLLCVFSKELNLTFYNTLLTEVYRESFGDGVAEKVGEILKNNSHDFTYQFHMVAMNNGAVRIIALDTKDNYIAHNYIVDFYPNEKFDFIEYGKQPRTPQGQQEILETYKRYLPFALKKTCTDNFQFVEI